MAMWNINSTDCFNEWFSELEPIEQAEIIAKVNLLKLFGPRLSRPHADTLKDSKHANMKELRADTSRSVMRVAFAFDPQRTGILLVAGNKSGVSQRRFYQRLIEQADELFDEHLESLKPRSKKKGDSE